MAIPEKISFIAFVVVFAALLLILFSRNGFFRQELPRDFSCVTEEKETVRGVSMVPALQDGETVRLLRRYFQCNDAQKDQLVALEFATREGETFVKRIAAKKGDALTFREGKGRVNGRTLQNSEGKPYLFSEQSQSFLSLALGDGIIGEGYFLVLSEQEGPNAFDSRQFGFVEQEHLVGLVVPLSK